MFCWFHIAYNNRENQWTAINWNRLHQHRILFVLLYSYNHTIIFPLFNCLYLIIVLLREINNRVTPNWFLLANSSTHSVLCTLFQEYIYLLVKHICVYPNAQILTGTDIRCFWYNYLFYNSFQILFSPMALRQYWAVASSLLRFRDYTQTSHTR
jgi:hypothetical protein